MSHLWEIESWNQINAADAGLEITHPNVWQHKEDPDLLGYVHFQGTSNGKPDPKFVNRIDSLEGLDHPNILKLLDYDLEAERPYMVTELCKGGTIRDVDLSRWSVKKKMILFSQVCAGFAYLWENGLTKSDQDFKNTFLTEDHRPVIGDFESGRKIETNAEGVHQVLNQAGKFFWELMEGKRFNQVLGEEMRIQRQLVELTEQIEELQQQKADLLNK